VTRVLDAVRALLGWCWDFAQDVMTEDEERADRICRALRLGGFNG
jgi:hypothetical protein